ncbi:uncharacterized protein LOC122405411 [Colletes gigas]|uniref:uncharacterized protein LOC122405411 n=1 Tax=Colletes gigas TaxID=935657 RepID=UPI001C9B6097|nr:uncharacterized protein LOC122405411 [Colletes gigas]
MEVMWNRKQLEHPPNASFRIEREKFDVTGFQMILEMVIKDLSSQELLHKEAAILSRLIYRMKSKFRNDKGVKAMSKVNRALLNYLSLSLEKEYENLKSYIEADDEYVKLPSKQMLEFVLVRTQGFAKLMVRVEEVSKHAAHFLKCRIALGHAWSVSIIAYAVISRIWILSRHLIKKSCTWYNGLYQYLKTFKASGMDWLPRDYEIANNLETWLALPWINEPTPSVPDSSGLTTTMFKLIIPRDDESDEDEEIKVKNISTYAQEKNVIPNIVPKDENKNELANDDAGEVIDRHTFSLIHTAQQDEFTNNNHTNLSVITKKKKHKVICTQDNSKKIETAEGTKPEKLNKKRDSQKLLTLENVKCKADLTILLNKESYPGLDKLQWNMIRNKSKKLLNKLDACSDETNQSILFKKVIKRIQRSIA